MSLVTEKGATHLTCPVMQNGDSSQKNCRGAKCMAWRWHDDERGPDGELDQERRGYCGMAGPVGEGGS